MKTYKGKLKYEKDWCLVELDKDFLNQFQTPQDIKPTNRPHISVMKSESPSTNADKWGYKDGDEITFTFDNKFEFENGRHLWINVQSDELCQLREFYGLPTLKDNPGDTYRVLYHITLGKLINPTTPNLRPQIRISPRTHIDPSTMMQHI